MVFALYHVWVLVYEALLLRAFGKSGALGGVCGGGILWILLAVIGALVGESFVEDAPHGGRFTFLGLLAGALFLHGPLVLIVASTLMRRNHKLVSRAVAASAVALIVLGAQAFFVEPDWLEVTHYRIANDKVVRPIKICVLADIQTDSVGDYERGVLRRAMEERPDLILLPGDYVQSGDPLERKQAVEDLRALFRETGVGAPLGVFATRGNVEDNAWETIFEGLPVTAGSATTRHELDGLVLTTLSLADSFDTDFDLPEEEGLHVVVGHAPDFVLGPLRADLYVAGHTHGGQVRLPFFGALMTLSNVPQAWASGLTEFERSGALVVSRGIGMERGYAPRMRLFCRPELVVIELGPPE